MIGRVSKDQMLMSLAILCVLGHVGLVGYSAMVNAPTYDEPGHLVAGVSHWTLGRFDLYRVNPPLVRMVAALPVLCTDATFPWEQYSDKAGIRTEHEVGQDFIAANGQRIFQLHVWARCACLVFTVLGAAVCYRWSRELYGSAAATLGVVLWCACPNILGNAQLITSDVGATALGTWASYCFWRWLKSPDWERTCTAGVILGVAELTKTSLLVLPLLWPFLWIAYRWCKRHEAAKRKWIAEGAKLVALFTIALFLLNLGYGFEGSFRRLGDYRFVTKTLGGEWTGRAPFDRLGNRFAGTIFAALPVPLPKNYLLGLDLQKLDFEQKKWSYMCGEWRHGGWLHYYVYVLLLKVPLGNWCLLALAATSRPRLAGASIITCDELILITPAVGILLLVSSQTGMNQHGRYVLPVLPLAYIWLSRIASDLGRKRPVKSLLSCVALIWSIGSSLSCFPHSLSYFNELAGGPRGGHWHLGGSNVDWGQDLLFLKDWLDVHPEVENLSHVTDTPHIGLKIFGIDAPLPPVGRDSRFLPLRPQSDYHFGPRPGWFAIGVNRLHSRFDEYRYFQRFDPVATVGYTTNIYCITLVDANFMRMEIGMAALPEARDDDVLENMISE